MSGALAGRTVVGDLRTGPALVEGRVDDHGSEAGLTAGAFLRTEHVETVTDEDRLPHYKLFAMRWRVEG